MANPAPTQAFSYAEVIKNALRVHGEGPFTKRPPPASTIAASTIPLRRHDVTVFRTFTPQRWRYQVTLELVFAHDTLPPLIPYDELEQYSHVEIVRDVPMLFSIFEQAIVGWLFGDVSPRTITMTAHNAHPHRTHTWTAKNLTTPDHSHYSFTLVSRNPLDPAFPTHLYILPQSAKRLSAVEGVDLVTVWRNGRFETLTKGKKYRPPPRPW